MTFRLWTLLKKDARVVLRSRLLLAVLVLYPLVIVGIIGYAFSEPTQKIPLAVVNQDVDADGDPNTAVIEDPFGDGSGAGGATVSSGELVTGLEELTRVTKVDDVDAAKELLLTGEVQAVVVLPPGFVDQVVRFGNGSARLDVIVDQSDPVRATLMEVNIRGVVQQFQELVIQQKVDIVVQALEDSLRVTLPEDHFAYPGFTRAIDHLRDVRASLPDSQDYDDEREKIDTAIEFLQNIELGVINAVDIVRSVAQPVVVDIEQEESGHLFIRDLVVPAALGLSIFWTGSLATAALIVYDRESAAYTRLGVTPTGRTSILGAKVLLTSLVVFAQSAIILLAAVAFFGTRVDNLGLTVMLVVLSTLASIAIGVFLSGVTRDVNGAVLLSVLVTFPMLFLAGLFYPVDFMPQGAQFLARLFPLTYTVSGLRGSMLRGFDFGDATAHLVALALTAVVLTALGVLLGRRFEGKD